MTLLSWLLEPPHIRRRLIVVAAGWVIIGGLIACGTGVALVPAVRAAHGGGVAGTITLTAPSGCDRYPPPRQRCGWFGDFRSDDGKTVRSNKELVGGLPPGAHRGDRVPARDTGDPAGVYPRDDSQSWRQLAVIFGVSLAAFLLGSAVLWNQLSRRRRSP